MPTKYVDETTAFDIGLKNSIIILDVLVREIIDYCKERDKMNLNPKS